MVLHEYADGTMFKEREGSVRGEVAGLGRERRRAEEKRGEKDGERQRERDGEEGADTEIKSKYGR